MYDPKNGMNNENQNVYRKKSASADRKPVNREQYRKATAVQGEVYKKSKPVVEKKTVSSKTVIKNKPNSEKKQVVEKTPEMIKLEKRKAARKKMIISNVRRVSIIMAIVVFISVSIATFAISCVNDVLAIHIPAEKDLPVSVVIDDGMNTSEVIDTLGDAGVIKNAWFCKLAAKFFGYKDSGYIARTYELKRSMGLENMLNEIKNNTSKAAKTVYLTFPEGYTVDQIFNLLEESKVCSRASLIETMNSVDFSKEFDFLASMTDSQSRYMLLEGYLFPDTYEFYIGENAESVIKRFLNNFKSKWTASYEKLAVEKKLTVDKVIKLASIVEKEAVGADMPIVGSILFNRLKANMRFECDSTGNYIKGNMSNLSESDLAAFDSLYNTYICSSYPVGAICNPGIDSIEAVLKAPDTAYYYFIHDKNNEFHVAKSLDEQNYNIRTYGLAE